MPRIAILALLLLPLLAPPCLAEDDPQTRTQVEALFARIQKAANASDRNTIASLFDADAMFEALERDGFLESLPTSGRESFARGLKLGLQKGLARNDFVPPFASFEIRTLKPGPRDGLLVVYLRTKDEAGLVTKARWYLVRRSTSWRVYDFEDLDVNLRITAVMGLVLADALSGGKLQWRQAAQNLRQAQQLMVAGELDPAYRLLLEVEPVALPKPLQGVVQMLLAAIEVGTDETGSAFERLARAEALNPDMPIVDYLKAIAFNDDGEYDLALTHARRYVERLDADAQVNLEIGRAFHGLDQKDKAIEPLEHAIAEAPGESETLAYLAMALPPPRHGELAAHFARLRDTAVDFEFMAELCLSHEETAALKSLTALFAKLQPTHRDVPYYEGMVLRDEEKFDESAKRFAQALDRLEAPENKDVDRWPYDEAWLNAMIAAGKAMEAFERARDKAHALQTVGEFLVGEDDAEGLRVLVQQSAAVPGVEERRTYYRGEIEYIRRSYDIAVRILRPLQASMARALGDDNEPGRLLWDVEDRLVRSLVRTKQSGEALRLAETIDTRDEDPTYVVIVHVVSGDVERATKAIRASVEAGFDADVHFKDEDAGPLLATEPYRKLREELLGEG